MSESPESHKSLFPRASAKAASVFGGIRKAATKARDYLNPITPMITKADDILENRFDYYLMTRPLDTPNHLRKILKRAKEILNSKWVKFMSLHPTMAPVDIPKYLADYAEKQAFAEDAFNDRVITSDLRGLVTERRNWNEGKGGKKKGKSRKSSKSSKTRKNRKTRSRK
jgi:hypothetical protein